MRALSLILMALLLVAAGCNRDDMHTGSQMKPHEESPVFADGSSARPLVEGTLERGGLRLDEHLYRGTINGKPAETFPFAITPEILQRGQQRYDIFCSACHGGTGDGQGMVVKRGFLPPPSYHIDRLRDAPVGHFYQVMNSGWGAMYNVADRVSVEDRWAIAAYVRVLQLSQHAQVSALTPEEQDRISRSKP